MVFISVNPAPPIETRFTEMSINLPSRRIPVVVS
jgi:hypothetical protein